jgi:alpha-1,6-mannosyltransferase
MVARWQGDAPRSLVMHADPLSAYAYRYLRPMMSREAIDRRFEPFWKHLRDLGQSFDRVVCASGELRDRLARGGVANTVLHPMGIEAGLFSPSRRDATLRRRLLATCGLPESAHLLIGVGRLSGEKRWPMVVDAVTAASQSLPIGLVIVGRAGTASASRSRSRATPISACWVWRRTARNSPRCWPAPTR